MSNLQETFQIKLVAFQWEGVLRTYRCDEVTVDGDEKLETWVSGAKKQHHDFEGVYLDFTVFSPFMQITSHSTSLKEHGWTALRNAILSNTISVEFFPIYDLDQSIGYEITPDASGKKTVLKVIRGLTYPEVKLQFKTKNQLGEYPEWLENIRYRG